MKLGRVTKLDRRNKTMSKSFDKDAISENRDVIFAIYGRFEAMRKSDSGRILCKTFYLTKTENRTNKSPTQLSHYYFE